MHRLLAATILLATSTTAFGQGDAKVASGLKEALSIGASQAVRLTGVTDGFAGNSAIKIGMPESCAR
jgi:Protein of unknown function (DUF4197)